MHFMPEDSIDYNCVTLKKTGCKKFPLTDCTAFLSNLFLYFTVLTLQHIFMISNLNLLFWNFSSLLFILSSDYTKMDEFSSLTPPLTFLKDYRVCCRSRYVYQFSFLFASFGLSQIIPYPS